MRPNPLNPVTIVGGIKEVSASFTRPDNTTQYASGDLIANNATASSVAPMTFSDVAGMPASAFLIRRARLYKDDDDTTSANFRLHLFKTDPTATDPSNGDNGAIQLTGVLTDHIGSIDFNLSTVDVHTDGNMGTGTPINGSEIMAELSSGRDIYGLLEARGTYTPASEEVFTVVLEIHQD